MPRTSVDLRSVPLSVRQMLESEKVVIDRVLSGRHLMLRVSSMGRKAVLVVSKTASDHRTLRNLRADMRRLLRGGKQ